MPAAPKPKRKRKKRDNFGSKDFKDWFHKQPCAYCGRVGHVQMAHVEGRGMGGRTPGFWKRNLLPLCDHKGCNAHNLFDGHHGKGRETFFKETGWDIEYMKHLAERIYERWTLQNA